MSFRETSLQAWQQLQNSGELGRRQLEVVRVLLRAKRPVTAGEIGKQPDAPPGHWKRLSELERMNIVVRMKPQKCTVTGQMADTWAIAGKGRDAVELVEFGRSDELRRLRKVDNRFTKMNDACDGDPEQMELGDRGLVPKRWSKPTSQRRTQ